MISTSRLDILFDDFTLLEQQIGRNRLIAASINANCDCVGSPALNTDCDGHPSKAPHDNRYTDQIAQPVAQAH